MQYLLWFSIRAYTQNGQEVLRRIGLFIQNNYAISKVHRSLLMKRWKLITRNVLAKY